MTDQKTKTEEHRALIDAAYSDSQYERQRPTLDEQAKSAAAEAAFHEREAKSKTAELAKDVAARLAAKRDKERADDRAR